MDGLALLCTLHADGPSTLKRLRSVGCSDLEAFLAQPTEELARLLELTPAHARRLRREAGLLRERVGGGLLQEEESGPVPPASEDETDPSERPLTNADRAILGRVIEKWRERDTREVQPRPTAAPSPDRREPLEAADAFGALDLRPGALAGLSAELVNALARLEIASLAALAGADSAWVAVELGVPFSEVRRLQFLARRALPDPVTTSATDADATPPAASVPPVSPRARSASRANGELPFGAGIGSGEPASTLWDFEIPRPADQPAEERETSGGPFA